ncbi:MAG: metal ABC transporter ATP-binding protein [Parcubacteria group bacterium]|nr:metal ABC transporter ATP-binding protein [Parcubacteria group bacterium]
MPQKLISINNLGVSFDGKTILDNVTFDIELGDILAIIGPNGAGKTILLKSILGLNKNYSGEILWHRRPETGYVPQKINFDKDFPLTVKEFFLLEIGSRSSFWLPTPDVVGEIKRQLQEVKAAHLINERLGTLSQGEMQRVLIARGLLENPKLIFFDEPASGIDVGTEETVYNLLHELYLKNNLTMILVSHELNIVYRFATKVICLNKNLICQGLPSEVLNPQTLHKIFGHHAGVYKHEHGLREHDHN